VNDSLSGIFGILVAIIAWGSYTVPLKKAQNLNPLWFQFWLSMGIGASSLALGLFRGFAEFPWWGIFSGLVWTAGAACSFLAVQHEGLSGASTRWMGTGILVSFLIGVVILGEKVALVWALPGVLLLLLGLILVSRAGDAQPTAKTSFSPLRYWRSVFAGTVFGSYLLPLQWAHVDSFSFVPPMGLGIVIGGVLLLLIKKPKASLGWRGVSMGCGLAWNLANVGSLIAVRQIGFAVGFPLTQLALLVSISWGIFAFGESNTPRQRRNLLIAAILLLSGAALLGIAHL